MSDVSEVPKAGSAELERLGLPRPEPAIALPTMNMGDDCATAQMILPISKTTKAADG